PAQMDEDRLAAFGYLQGLSPAALPVAAEANPGDVSRANDTDETGLPRASEASRGARDQAALIASHRRAASLVAQKKYSAALDALRAIAAKHQDLASVQYQIGSLLVRTGRVDEGIKALTAVAAARPDDPEIPVALAYALLHV